MVQYFPVITGSLTVQGNIIATGNITTSGSVTISGSIASASYAETSSNALTLQGLGSASLAPAGTFNTVSQSFASTSGSVAGRVTLIEGQYATTGSNNFTKPQQVSDVSNAISFTSTASLYTAGGARVGKDLYVSGTAYFNNVTVYGTQSVNYITSSQLDISDNIITVNTFTPAVRYGGLGVYDSGSTGLSGSMLWDSEQNRWIYSNPSGSSYDGGMIISGPRNTTGLGNEQGTLSNYVTKGQGGDHITSSAIYETASMVGIGTASPAYNLDVTGTGRLTGNLYVSGTVITNNPLAIKLNYAGSVNDIQLGAGTPLRVVNQAYDSVLVYINNTGSVGLGTNNPTIIGTNYTTLDIRGTSGGGVNFGVSGSTYAGLYTDAGGVNLSTAASVPILFGANNSEKMRITPSGVLQINTTANSTPYTTGTYKLIAKVATDRNIAIGLNAGDCSFEAFNDAVNTSVPLKIFGSPISLWGNVGINTTSPTNIGAYKSLTIDGTDGSIVDLRYNGSGNGRLFSSSATAVGMESLSTSLPLEFKTQNGSGSTVRMTVLPAGQVGIGTTTPQRAFVVARSNGQGIEFDNQTGYATILSYNRTTSTYTPLTMGEGTTNVGIGTTSPEQKLEVNGYIKMSGTSNAAYFGGVQASWAGSSNYPTLYGANSDRWVMHINPHVSYVQNGINGYAGTSYGAMIRMAADPAANNYWDTGILYSLGGDKWGINRNNTNLASLTTGGTWSTTGGGTSDARTKQNIEYIETSGLNAINVLKPAKFEFIINPEKTRRGFIAQDVLEVMPDLVLGDGEREGGTYGLDYDGILALAVKAIQELSAKVDQQAAEIEALKAK